MSQSLTTSSQRLFIEFPGAQGSTTVSVWGRRVSLVWFLIPVLTKAFLFTLSSFFLLQIIVIGFPYQCFVEDFVFPLFCFPPKTTGLKPVLNQWFKNHWPGKECLPNRLQNLQGLNEIIHRILSTVVK